MSYFLLFFSAAIVNNFVLSYFLGICPFVGVSKRISAAVSMGLAVTFVMLITAVVTWLIYHLILVPFKVEILEYVSFILVIAALVQLVEQAVIIARMEVMGQIRMMLLELLAVEVEAQIQVQAEQVEHKEQQTLIITL